jgi:hypothetical protein
MSSACLRYLARNFQYITFWKDQVKLNRQKRSPQPPKRADDLHAREDAKAARCAIGRIEAMKQTGREMSHEYKETALGGLAVSQTECRYRLQ